MSTADLKNSKKSTSVTTSTRMEEVKKKEVPKGAIIINSTVTTETEQIENGWLITKRYDVSYRMTKDGPSDYVYYNKKWFSKEDPLTINIKDKSLAEAFEE